MQEKEGREVEDEAHPGGLPGMVSFHSRLAWELLPGGTLVMGRTDLPLFRYHDRSGSLIREVRLPLTNRPVTGDDEERIMAEMREEPGIAPYLARFVSGDRWPLYNRMIRVSDTMIAIQHGRWSMAREEPLPEEEVRGVLRLFTVSGRYVGALPYPREVWPLLGEGDRVLAYQDDALGARNVRISTLVPPAR